MLRKLRREKTQDSDTFLLLFLSIHSSILLSLGKQVKLMKGLVYTLQEKYMLQEIV